MPIVLPQTDDVSPRMSLLGFMAGKIHMADDFNETPDDIIDLMIGGPP